MNSEWFQAIEALRERQEASQLQIDELRQGVAELREVQAQLMQIFVQEREEFWEFRCLTNATLARIDRSLSESNQRFDAMQQQITGLQSENSRILDYLLRRGE